MIRIRLNQTLAQASKYKNTRPRMSSTHIVCDQLFCQMQTKYSNTRLRNRLVPLRGTIYHHTTIFQNLFSGIPFFHVLIYSSSTLRDTYKVRGVERDNFFQKVLLMDIGPGDPLKVAARSVGPLGLLMRREMFFFRFNKRSSMCTMSFLVIIPTTLLCLFTTLH